MVKCNVCDLVYLSPRPPKSEIGRFYPRQTYWADLAALDRQAHLRKKRDMSYGFLYNLVLQQKHKGSILDIGAGTGVFLTRFQELGWEVDGVELSRDAVATGQKVYGIRLKSGDFFDHQFVDKQFDVITLNNSLEHLYNPREVLERVFAILKDDGILLITVPNIESLGLKIFRKHWYPLQPPRHLTHFSPKTLEHMLSLCGFTVTNIKHSYWEHNYYSLFESFRFLASPRFKKRKQGGLANEGYKKTFSPVLEAGKIFARLFALATSLAGAILGRGEVITVCAKKRTH